MSLTDAIRRLKSEMEKAGIRQEQGLGTELFHFSSTLAPVVNVDLFIMDADGRVLLSWRDDPHTGIGWHVPGTCIRFRETLEQSIQRCARTEIGTEVFHFAEPIKVYEFHWNTFRAELEDQRERAHFITLVYACRLPGGYDLSRQVQPEEKPGYLKWFDTIPDDFLPFQKCYREDWEQLKKRIAEER